MEHLDVFKKLGEVDGPPLFSFAQEENSEQSKRIAEHKLWLKSIRHERPNTARHFRIGVYIRFFNQTKYEDYLDYHKKQFVDSIALCPMWELVDFYIDEGSTAPNMETAPEWSRLINDCMDGRVDLIITQKVSNVSKKPAEIALCARLLATQQSPIGMYFISEDIFTLASYYQEDLHDDYFLPDGEWTLLPDDALDVRGRLDG